MTSLRAVVLALPALMFAAACGGASSPTPEASLPSTQLLAGTASPTSEAQAARAAPVEGWNTTGGPISVGRTLPEFKTKRVSDGAEVSSEDFRGKWTILAFWGLWSPASVSDARYISALFSATAQDPDLKTFAIHIPPAGHTGPDAFGAYGSLKAYYAKEGAFTPSALDDTGAIARSFGIQDAPTYLLVGPDLTVEAWRGPFASSEDGKREGIKIAIKGVDEIRKQIAAPE